jgi:hypothetical protein
MRRTGVEERIGADNFHLTVAEAVAVAVAPQATATGGPGAGPLPAGD